MSVDYISRKVMDRYFDKFTRKLVRINVRIMETESAWNRLTLLIIDLGTRVDLMQTHLEELDESTARSGHVSQP